MRKAIFVLVLSLLVATAASAQVSLFTGNWVNANPATRGIVKMTLTGATPVLSIQVWGACHPTPCDWGKKPAYAYGPAVGSNPVGSASAVTALYKTGFSETILVLTVNPTGMTASAYTRFTDGSGRYAYTSTEHFNRVP